MSKTESCKMVELLGYPIDFKFGEHYHVYVYWIYTFFFCSRDRGIFYTSCYNCHFSLLFCLFGSVLDVGYVKLFHFFVPAELKKIKLYNMFVPLNINQNQNIQFDKHFQLKVNWQLHCKYIVFFSLLSLTLTHIRLFLTSICTLFYQIWNNCHS